MRSASRPDTSDTTKIPKPNGRTARCRRAAGGVVEQHRRLHVQVEEVEQSDRRDRVDERADVPAREHPVGQEAEMHQRLLRTQLDENERREPGRGDGENSPRIDPDPHPRPRPVGGARIAVNSPRASSPMPAMSNRTPFLAGEPDLSASGGRGAGRRYDPPARCSTRPTRQLMASVEHTADQRARPRRRRRRRPPACRGRGPCFSLGKASCRIAMVAGISIAAPMPSQGSPADQLERRARARDDECGERRAPCRRRRCVCGRGRRRAARRAPRRRRRRGDRRSAPMQGSWKRASGRRRWR